MALLHDICKVDSYKVDYRNVKVDGECEESVEWKYFQQTQDAVSWLKTLGYTVLAIEQCEGSTMLQNMQYDKEKNFAPGSRVDISPCL